MRFAATCLLVMLALGAPAPAVQPGLSLDPSKTRVGLARVHLQVSELREVERSLVGTYEVRIPLAPSRNDRGSIRFELDRPLDETLLSGRALFGVGLSELDGRSHDVSCLFRGRDAVTIRVDTGDRVLAFQTRYRHHI